MIDNRRRGAGFFFARNYYWSLQINQPPCCLCWHRVSRMGSMKEQMQPFGSLTPGNCPASGRSRRWVVRVRYTMHGLTCSCYIMYCGAPLLPTSKVTNLIAMLSCYQGRNDFQNSSDEFDINDMITWTKFLL